MKKSSLVLTIEVQDIDASHNANPDVTSVPEEPILDLFSEQLADLPVIEGNP